MHQIAQQNDFLHGQNTGEANGQRNAPAHTLQAELQAETRKINETFGWHFLAKDVADFCNISFFEVYDKPAIEIFATVRIIQNKIFVKQYQFNATPNP